MKTSMKKVILLIAISCLSLTTWAQTKSAPQQTRSSDKVDLKKLEDKYWAAKDEDYAVIQNRTFAKSGKFYLSGMYGTLVNDPFAQSKPYGANLGYYFNEDFGIEVSYLSNTSKKSDSVSKFNTIAANISPNYNLPGTSVALSVSYTPFYAKMSFMNMAIMYFDMGFTAGFGLSEYDQIIRLYNGSTPVGEGSIRQNSPHFEIGVMQQLFITKNFAVRLDLKNNFYNERTVTYDPGIVGVRQEENGTKNNTYIMLGLTLFSN